MACPLGFGFEPGLCLVSQAGWNVGRLRICFGLNTDISHHSKRPHLPHTLDPLIPSHKPVHSGSDGYRCPLLCGTVILSPRPVSSAADPTQPPLGPSHRALSCRKVRRLFGVFPSPLRARSFVYISQGYGLSTWHPLLKIYFFLFYQVFFYSIDYGGRNGEWLIHNVNSSREPRVPIPISSYFRDLF